MIHQTKLSTQKQPTPTTLHRTHTHNQQTEILYNKKKHKCKKLHNPPVKLNKKQKYAKRYGSFDFAVGAVELVVFVELVVVVFLLVEVAVFVVVIAVLVVFVVIVVVVVVWVKEDKKRVVQLVALVVWEV